MPCSMTGPGVRAETDGLIYRSPVGRVQRYDPAPTPKGKPQGFWFLCERDGDWHAFSMVQVKLIAHPKRWFAAYLALPKRKRV